MVGKGSGNGGVAQGGEMVGNNGHGYARGVSTTRKPVGGVGGHHVRGGSDNIV
jgi:hypothetical protein